VDDKDRLAYEVAMATLQDTREDCLRWLDDQKPAVTRRRSGRWWSFDPRPTPPKRRLAS
jgi:hypothetical protein